jgi:hypothetical protein
MILLAFGAMSRMHAPQLLVVALLVWAVFCARDLVRGEIPLKARLLLLLLLLFWLTA